MPELPEVETTRRGVEPYSVGRRVREVVVRDSRLRWPVPAELPERMVDQTIIGLRRRAKYLLFRTAGGTLMIHLGMSGSLRVIEGVATLRRHDHLDIVFDDGIRLRYNDPRRFGSVLWLAPDERHPLLDNLGPEPLSAEFSGEHLYRLAHRRRGPVKHFIMDAKIVVGVGNIYANEALFGAGIRPDRAADRISAARYEVLSSNIKQVLTSAIEQGGTTLRDYVNSAGQPGYFAQQLLVYGRGGQPCKRCGTVLRERRLSQRTTIYCVLCQR